MADLSQDRVVSNNQKLYNNLLSSGKVSKEEVGDYETFNSYLSDTANVSKLHENLKKKGFDESTIGTRDEFLQNIDPAPDKITTQSVNMSENEDQPLTYMQKQLRERFPENYTEEKQPERKTSYIPEVTTFGENKQPSLVGSIPATNPDLSAKHPEYFAPKISDSYKTEKPTVIPQGTGDKFKAVDQKQLESELGGAKINSNQPKESLIFSSPEEEKFDLAKNITERSKRQVDAVTGQGDNTGVGDALRDRNFWTLGSSDLSSMIYLKRISNKLEKGESLSDGDKALLEAWNESEQVNKEYPASDANIWYKTGKNVTDMIPWLIQFASTRGAGATARRGMELTLKQNAEKYLGKTIATGLSKGAAEVAGAYAAAAFMPNTYADITRRSLGETYHDEKGNIQFDTNTADNYAKAIYKGWTNGMLEVLTERLGEGVTNGIKLLPKNKFTSLLTGEAKGKVGKIFTDFTRAVGWNGAPLEYLEEWVNIPLNAMLVGDNKYSDMFNGQQQLETFLTVAAMGSAMGSVQYASNKYDTYRVNKDYKSAKNLFDNDIEESTRNTIESLTNSDLSVADLSQQLNGILSSMDGEKAGIVMNYVVQSMKYNNLKKTPITTATIEGQQFTINNPEDLGQEGKPIFAKDAEGNVTAVPNHKVENPITQTVGEIEQAKQQEAERAKLYEGIADPNAESEVEFENEITDDNGNFIGNIKIVNFSNGQSKIIFNDKEMVANDANEKDRILNSLESENKFPEPEVKETGEVVNPIQIPTLEDGSPDYESMEPDMFFQEYSTEFGQESALQEIASMQTAVSDKIKKLTTKKEKSISPNERASIQREIKGLAEKLDKLNNVSKIANNSEQQTENVSETQQQLSEQQQIVNSEQPNSQQLNQLENEKPLESSPVDLNELGQRPASTEGENTPQAQQGQGVNEGLEENVNELAPPPSDKMIDENGNMVDYKPNNTISFYHGGLSEDFDINNLDITRPAQKQQKKGRNYAGFYMYDESQRSGAETYSNQTGKGLHRFDIDANANILELGNIERLTQNQILEYKNQGYDLLQGTDVRGRTEYVLLNKDIVKNVVNEKQTDITVPPVATISQTPVESAPVESAPLINETSKTDQVPDARKLIEQEKAAAKKAKQQAKQVSPEERKLRSINQARAQSIEPSTIEQLVLQYIAAGNRLNWDEIKREVFPRSDSEMKQRIWMLKKDGKTIDELLGLLNGTPMEEEGNQPNVFRNAVIDSVLRNGTRTQMVDRILEIGDQNNNQQDIPDFEQRMAEAMQEQELLEQQLIDAEWENKFENIDDFDVNELFLQDYERPDTQEEINQAEVQGNGEPISTGNRENGTGSSKGTKPIPESEVGTGKELTPLDKEIQSLQKEREELLSKKANTLKNANARNGLFGDIAAKPNDLFAGQGFDATEAQRIVKSIDDRIFTIDQSIVDLTQKNEQVKATAEKENAGQLKFRTSDKPYIQETIDELQAKAPNAAPVVIVRSLDQVPEEVRNNPDFQNNQVEAFYLNRKVYVFPDMIKSRDHLITIWIHENGLHNGIRNIMSYRDMRLFMNYVYDSFYEIGRNNPEFRQITERVNADYRGFTKQEKAEEFLAYLAERKVSESDLSPMEQTMWEKYLDMFRDFLRRLFNFNSNLLTEKQIIDIARFAVQSNFQTNEHADSNARTSGSLRERTSSNTSGSKGRTVNAVRLQNEASAGLSDEAGSGRILPGDGGSEGLTISPQASEDLKSRHNALDAITRIGTELNIPVQVVNSSELTSDNNQLVLTDNEAVTIVSDRVKSVSEVIKALVKEVAGEKGIREMLANADPNSIVGKQLAKFDELPDGKIDPEKLAQIIRKAFRLTSGQFTNEDLIDAVVNQKSNISNNVQFRTSDKPEENNLIAVHNIKPAGLLNANRLGGLPMPSLAIVDINNGFDKYGDITLIADKDFIDPKKNRYAKVFAADVYSARYPNITYQIPRSGENKIVKKVSAYFDGSLASDISHRIKSEIEDGGLRSLSRDQYAQLLFLADTKRPFEIKYSESKVSDDVKQAFKDNGWMGLMYHEISDNNEVKKQLTDLYMKKYESDPEYYEVAKERFVDQDGILNSNLLRNFIRDVQDDIQKAGKVDTYSTVRAADEYIRNNNLQDEFESYAAELYDEIGVDEKIFKGFSNSGNRMYSPHTLENVLKEMKKDGIRGGEKFGYGAGNVRAQVTPEFKSLPEIQKNRGRIMPFEDDLKSKANDELMEVMDSLKKFYKYESGSFGYYDNASDELVQLARSGRSESFKPIDEESRKMVADFLDKLANMPTEYFEAKINRGVSLAEFKNALIPENTIPEIKDILKFNGINAVEYKDNADRAEKLKELAEEKNLRFRILGETGASNLDKAEEVTTRLDNLKVAREMEQAGKDVKSIRLATGWERGKDGKFKYEVPDIEIKESFDDILNKVRNTDDKSLPLSDLINDNDNLFKEYPTLKNTKILFYATGSNNVAAFANNTENVIGITVTTPEYEAYRLGGSIQNRPIRAYSDDSFKSVLSHEIQHIIQFTEGFGRGGNPETVFNSIVENRIRQLQKVSGRDAISESEREEIEREARRKYETSQRAYNRLVGEVESRNVQTRMSMTPEERLNTLLSETEDVSREDQIVLMDGLGVNDLRSKITHASSEANTEPSEAQKSAGNYRMGHIRFDGFDISIENPKGSVRSGVDKQGNEWSQVLPADYGYFRGVDKSKDGDHVDVYIGPKPEASNIYIIDQIDPETGKFDEHKVMLGFDSQAKAKQTYLAAFEPGWEGLGKITKTDKQGLKEWFEKGNQKKPFSDNHPQVRFRFAFHGSPHSFDKFSLDKIGTGEGAQAYGWGLYFTDKKSIAEQYADKLKPNSILIGGKTYDQVYSEIGDTPALSWVNIWFNDGYSKDEIVKKLNSEISDPDRLKSFPWIQPSVEKVLSYIKDKDFEKDNSNRNLYTVKIHGDKTLEELKFLRWDKPVSPENQGKIFKQLREEKIYPSNAGSAQKFWSGKSSDWENGEMIYSLLEFTLGSQKAASEFLLRAGIDGIIYPAEYLSKGSHEDAFNYVVFDENAVQIQEHTRFRIAPRDERIDQLREDLEKITSLAKSTERLDELTMSKIGKQMAERKTIVNQISKYKEGYRAGKNEKRFTLLVIQRNIAKYADENMKFNENTQAEIDQLLTAVRNANTPSTIEKAFYTIDSLASKGLKRKLIGGISKILKSTRPKNVNGKPKGLLNPDTHQVLKKIREVVNLKSDQDFEKYVTAMNEEDVESVALFGMFADLRRKSIDDIQKALDHLSDIVNEGKVWYKDEMKKRKDYYAGITSKVLDKVTGGGPHMTEQEYIAAGRVPKDNFLNNYVLANQSLEWLLDIASKDKKEQAGEGWMQVHFGDLLNESTNKETKGIREAIELVNKAGERIFGAKENALARIFSQNSKVVKNSKVTFATNEGRLEIPLSQNKAAKRWMEMQDPTLTSTFIKQGWDNQSLLELEAFMKPEVKKWAEWQLNEFYPEYFKSVNEAFRNNYFVDMPFNPKYSPIRREVIQQNSQNGELLKGSPMINSVMSGSFISRIANINNILLQDANTVLFNHIAEMEHFKAWINTVKEMRSTLGSRDVQHALTYEHGDKLRREINNSINDFATGGEDKANAISKIDRIRGNFAVGELALNLSLFPKQAISILTFMADVPIKNYLTGLVDMAINMKSVLNMMKRSEFIKERYLSGWNYEVRSALKKETPEILSNTKSKFNEFKNKLMFPAQFGDYTSAIGGWTVYKYYYEKQLALELLKPGITQEQAEQNADKEAMTRYERSSARLLQSSALKDAASIQKGSFGKMFTMFKSQPQLQQRYESAGWRNLVRGRGSKAHNLKLIALFHVLLPVAFQAMANMFTDDDDDEKLKRLLIAGTIGSLNGFLIASDVIEFLIEKAMGDPFDYALSPLEGSVNKMGTGAASVVKGIKNEEGDDEKAKEQIVSGLDKIVYGINNIALGLPYRPAKKLIKQGGDILNPERVSSEKAEKFSKELFKEQASFTKQLNKSSAEDQDKILSNTELLDVMDDISMFKSEITMRSAEIRDAKNKNNDMDEQQRQEILTEYPKIIDSLYKELSDKYKDYKFPDSYKPKE